MNSANRTEDGHIIAQAAGWHVASSGDAMDWDGFTAWLEADARHRVAYDEVAVTDQLVAEHRQAWRQREQALNPTRLAMRWRRWPLVGLGAAAAAIIAIVAGPAPMGPREHDFITGTAPRAIAMADGSQVILAPHSRLVIAGSSGTVMQLTGGAWFDVRHVAARQLAITAGPLTIRDIGTQFDIQVDQGIVRVAVAQGHVTVASPTLTQPIALRAGSALLFDGQNELATVTSASGADVGGWRHDRLTYVGAPLALVADDLARYAGIHLDVPASLRSRRFSGTLIVGNGSEAPRDLAQLMELALVRAPDGMRLVPRPDRPPPG